MLKGNEPEAWANLGIGSLTAGGRRQAADGRGKANEWIHSVAGRVSINKYIVIKMTTAAAFNKLPKQMKTKKKK